MYNNINELGLILFSLNKKCSTPQYSELKYPEMYVNMF